MMFVLGLILGIFLGIFLMCILQVSRKEKAISVPTNKTIQIVQDLFESIDNIEIRENKDMKCPERYITIQQNIILFMLDDDNITRGEYHIFIETQDFHDCYKEQCAAWDKEKQICRKVGK